MSGDPNVLYDGNHFDVLRRHVRDESIDLVYGVSSDPWWQEVTERADPDGGSSPVADAVTGLGDATSGSTRPRMPRTCSRAVSHMSVDSAPWLWFTPAVVRPSRQPPSSGSAIARPRSFRPRNQA